MKKTKSFQKNTLRCLSLCAALAACTPLWAQSTSTPEAPVNAAASTPSATQVGDATRNLWQRQREGREASATPRPIDGSVAELSQQRHLKSFEQPLPEWFDSRLKSK